ncbi:hypothetical protein ACH5RR_027182 [Cinchona calisaya]|uniref:Homeobox domain-containing protein n=1 Tax=Cinchona calisaya TaxID=153742 RepID=A0ABD2Z803_9GENT
MSSMGISMKVHQLARGFWEHEPSLTLGCKRLRPLAPKLISDTIVDTSATTAVRPFDLKSFIRPESRPGILGSLDDKREPPAQLDTHPGGTRWNPTQEQIALLEMLYRRGMRTPNAQQIEQITSQLGKYGKIEGKNVFYWFQNHKARERQKQKRNNNLGLNNHSPRSPANVTTTSISSCLTHESVGDFGKEEDSPYKRKCRSWTFECLDEDKRYCRDEGNRTLELFPLHPENR